MHLFRPGTALHLFTLLISHGETWLKRAIRLMQSPSGDRSTSVSGRRVVVRVLLAVFIGLAVPQTSSADEPHAEFLEGLRSRGFFDTALEQLEILRTRGDIPKAFADTLDLERGITYREMGTASRIPEDREQALGQAELALKKFTSEHGDHPRAAFANFELGQLLLERARSILWDSESSGAGRIVVTGGSYPFARTQQQGAEDAGDSKEAPPPEQSQEAAWSIPSGARYCQSI